MDGVEVDATRRHELELHRVRPLALQAFHRPRLEQVQPTDAVECVARMNVLDRFPTGLFYDLLLFLEDEWDNLVTQLARHHDELGERVFRFCNRRSYHSWRVIIRGDLLQRKPGALPCSDALHTAPLDIPQQNGQPCLPFH